MLEISALENRDYKILTVVSGMDRQIYPEESLFGIIRLCRVMINCDPSDRIVYHYLTLMIDSFSCTHLGRHLNYIHFTLEICCKRVHHFEIVKFDAVVMYEFNNRVT